MSAARAGAAPPRDLADALERLRPGVRLGAADLKRVPEGFRLLVPWLARETALEVAVDARTGALAGWRHRARIEAARPVETVPSRADLAALVAAEVAIPEGAEPIEPEVFEDGLVWQGFERRLRGALVEKDSVLARIDASRGLVASLSVRWTEIPEEADERPVPVLTPADRALEKAELRAALESAARQCFARWAPGKTVVLEELDLEVSFSAARNRPIAEATYDVWIERGRLDVTLDAKTDELLGFEDPSLRAGGLPETAAELLERAADRCAGTGLVLTGAKLASADVAPAGEGTALVRVAYAAGPRTQTFDLDPASGLVARYRLAIT